MIEFLTGYTSGVAWFDWLANICVGVIVTAIVAMIIWWFAGDLFIFRSRDRREVDATLDQIIMASQADLSTEPDGAARRRPFAPKRTVARASTASPTV